MNFTTMYNELLDIRDTVNGIFCVNIDKRVRFKQHINARFCYYYIAVNFTNYNLTQIGAVLGYDHASVIHGTKQWENYYNQDGELKKYYSLVIRHLEKLPWFLDNYATVETLLEYHKNMAYYYKKLISLATGVRLKFCKF